MMAHAYDYRINLKKTGLQIRKLRLERGLSMEYMRDFFNCSLQTLYRWESGTSLPCIENQFAMARLFGVSMDDLIVGETCLREAA